MEPGLRGVQGRDSGRAGGAREREDTGVREQFMIYVTVRTLLFLWPMEQRENRVVFVIVGSL